MSVHTFQNIKYGKTENILIKTQDIVLPCRIICLVEWQECCDIQSTLYVYINVAKLSLIIMANRLAGPKMAVFTARVNV